MTVHVLVVGVKELRRELPYPLPDVRAPHRPVELLRALRVLGVADVPDDVQPVEVVRPWVHALALRVHLPLLPVVQVLQVLPVALHVEQPTALLRVVHEVPLGRLRAAEVQEVAAHEVRQREPQVVDVEPLPRVRVLVPALLLLVLPLVPVVGAARAAEPEEVLEGLREDRRRGRREPTQVRVQQVLLDVRRALEEVEEREERVHRERCQQVLELQVEGLQVEQELRLPRLREEVHLEGLYHVELLCELPQAQGQFHLERERPQHQQRVPLLPQHRGSVRQLLEAVGPESHD